MGIELNQHQIGMLFRHGSHGTGTDRVFSSQHQWFEAAIKHGFRG